MLKFLRAKNFKCYKDLEIEFSDKITAICGLPGHGKTPILSAAKLVSTLRPSGSSYISHFAKKQQCEIELEFENGEVNFQKTKSKSQYILNGDLNNIYSETNKKVPDEIRDLVKIDEDNFSFQFDGPYLIFAPNSTISKKINESIGIEKYDFKLKEINREIASSKKAIREVFKSIKLKKSTLKNIKNIGFDSIQDLISRRREAVKGINDLKNKCQRLEEWNLTLSKSKTEEIDSLLSRVKLLCKKHSKLAEKLNKNEKAYLDMLELEKIQNSAIIYRKIQVLKRKLTKLIEERDLIEINLERNKKIKSTISSLKQVQMEIINTESEIDLLTQERNDFEVCPECGQNLDKI